MNLFSKFFPKNEKKMISPKRTPLTIQVGDIVSYNMKDYEVVGKITYRDARLHMYKYQMVDENESIWLTAHLDETVQLNIYRTVPFSFDINFPTALEYQNTTFQKVKQSTARLLAYGTLSNFHGILATTAEYVNEGGKSYIQLETWGTEQKASIGYPVQPFEIKILGHK